MSKATRTLLIAAAVGLTVGVLFGVASAAPLPATIGDPATTPPLDELGQLTAAVHYGWGAGVLAILIALLKLAPRLLGSWLSVGRRGVVAAGALAVAIAAWNPLAAGLGWGPALLAAVGAVLAYVHPTTPASSPRTPQAGFARWPLIGVLGAVGLGLSLHGGCTWAQVKQGAGTGLRALLDCETPDLHAVAADGYRVGLTSIPAWIDGSGKPDKAALQASWDKLLSDQARCFESGVGAGVLAAATTPAKPTAGAAMSAPLVVDAAAVRQAIAGVRAGWGLAGVRVAGQVL